MGCPTTRRPTLVHGIPLIRNDTRFLRILPRTKSCPMETTNVQQNDNVVWKK